VIRAVLDTNVLVAAFQFPGGMCDKAFSLCLSGVVSLPIGCQVMSMRLSGVHGVSEGHDEAPSNPSRCTM
jgi:hypothetical protein